MLLTGRNLAKWYGPRLLFSGITLGSTEGERVGLIGANGSGKSTLLRIFAGLEKPDEGELDLPAGSFASDMCRRKISSSRGRSVSRLRRRCDR